MRIEKCSHHKEPLISLVFDTLQKKKQALVFVNTKRSAEKAAEDIAKKLPDKTSRDLARKMKEVLDHPTHQCERLAFCVERGVAFHHAGLHGKQKELVEDAFRRGEIKIICSTPTLAAGIDMPAFRAIIRDVKRFGSRGLTDIPVLEYLQMAGRAGRPRFDTFGEAIILSGSEGERSRVWDRYIHGLPEDIYSKLAVEPVLRTYVLTLIATRVAKDIQELYDFFEKTFWAHQYKDTEKLKQKVLKVVSLLEDWNFVRKEENNLQATLVGTRIAQLYVDPLSAYQLVQGLKKAAIQGPVPAISWLHLACSRLEMQPMLKVKMGEFDAFQEELAKHSDRLLESEPSMFDSEYEEYLHGFKTALLLHEWIDEKNEEYLLEHFESRPGETRVKIETADWLLYAAQELAKLLQYTPLLSEISKVRFRLRYGAREELLNLLKLREIGRVRARKLFSAGVHSISDVRDADLSVLVRLLGSAVAESIKKQVSIPAQEKESQETLVKPRFD